MAASSLQAFSGKLTFSLPRRPGYLKVPNNNDDGDDDGADYDGRQRCNSTGRYRALIMIINSNSYIISPIKSTYVRPSLYFNENEYC